MGSYVIYLGAFLLAISTASALKCYACNGFTCGYGLLSFTYPEIDCEESKSGSLLDVVTSIVPNQCVKITGKDESGSSFVIRNCTTYTSQAGCNFIASAMQLGSNLKDLDCYTCTSNLCNSAPKYTGMAAVGLVVACLAFLF